jgi:ubiquinone/menaquinone biosynthesis C-methylase UbiE
MSGSDKVFQGSIPSIYEDYLVPLIFEGFAEDLARRVAALSPKSVLETAAGTGVVTRALAPRLPADAQYLATDLNQPMLELAIQRQGEDPRIFWQRADALALPTPDATFDVVCCQFGVMFFPDRINGYREVKRVLKPGGTFVFNVWDRIEDNDFANEVTIALAGLFPLNPPRFLARTPHGYHDETLITQELRPCWFSQREGR